MKKKKILIVSRYFYPLSDPRSLRTTELAEEFARNGHQVTILTIRNDEVHDGFEKKHGVTIRDLGPLRYPTISAAGSMGALYVVKRALERGLTLFLEYPNIELTLKVKQALENESGYDLMISVAMPHTIHWGVAWARTEEHPIAKTWVADCGDPYVGRESDTYRVPRYFSIPEKRFCRKADYIAVPIEGAKEGYFPEFHEKIRVIPQGLTFPERPPTGSKKKKKSVPVFTYFGNIVSYQHYAIPFLQFLNRVNAGFRFIAYTRKPEFYNRFLDESAMKSCELREYVPRERLFRELTEVDFLVHFPYKTPTQRSLKLVDYAFTEKPILSFDDSDTARAAFREFLEGNYRQRMPQESIEKYRIENVCARFLDLCSEKEEALF